MPARKHTFVDLFSGCGGMSAGFAQSGRYRVVAGVDNHANAVAAFGANFPRAEALQLDLADPAAHDALVERFGGTIDVVSSGCPCQGFSTRNPKRLTGRWKELNQLPERCADLVDRLGVHAMVMEEVPPAAKHALPAVQERLERAGFRVQARVLNASHYGVPQARRRLIVVATRDGWTFEWPEPCSPDAVVTARAALARAPRPPPGPPVTPYARQRIDDLRAEGRRLIGGNFALLPLDKPSPTIHTKTLPGAGPYTLEASDGTYRTMTVEQAARLQSFPDDFVFPGNDVERRKLVGNAVPPLLARAVAQGLRPPSASSSRGRARR